jgi:hypothetical protein
LIAVNHPFPWLDPPPPVPLLRATLRAYDVRVGLLPLLNARLREGFLVNDVSGLAEQATAVVHSGTDNSDAKDDNRNDDDDDNDDIDDDDDDDDDEPAPVRIALVLPWIPNVLIGYTVELFTLNVSPESDEDEDDDQDDDDAIVGDDEEDVDDDAEAAERRRALLEGPARVTVSVYAYDEFLNEVSIRFVVQRVLADRI